MGMDTQTGQIRELKPGDELGPDEIAITQQEAEGLQDVPPTRRVSVLHEERSRKQAKLERRQSKQEKARRRRMAKHSTARNRKG